jgi:hypothetical protein
VIHTLVAKQKNFRNFSICSENIEEQSRKFEGALKGFESIENEGKDIESWIGGGKNSLGRL